MQSMIGRKCTAVLWTLALAVGLGLGAAASGAPAGPSRLAAQLSQGDEFMREGQLDKAIAAYRKAVALDPKDAEAHYKLAIALGRSNQFQEAIEQLETSRRLDPSNMQVLHTLAAAYEFTNQTDKALAAYRRIISTATIPALIADARKHYTLIKAKEEAQHGDAKAALERLRQLRKEQGDDPQVIFYMGVAEMLINLPDQAAADFKRVLELSPGNRNALEDLVKIYEQKGDFAAAVDYMGRLLKQIPPQAPDHRAAALRLAILQGRLALHNGDAGAALAAMQQALALDPNNVFANYTVGVIYQQQGQWLDAAKAFDKVLQRMPQNLDARLRLAGVYLQTGQVPQAVAQLRVLADKASETPQGRKAKELLADIQAKIEQQGGPTVDLDAEIKHYEAVVAKEPDQVDTRMRLGALYLRKNDLKKALAQYQAVIKLQPANENAHGTIASIDENLNDFDGAVAEYAIAVSLEPDPGRGAGIARLLLLALGRQYFNAHDLKRATAVFARVLAQDPQNAMALFYTGLVYSSESRLEDAAGTFETLLNSNPNHLGARINLGLVYERLHREDDAIRQYRYVLEQDSKSTIGEEAQRRLDLVERRINGLITTMDYHMVYDSNSSLSAKPTNEYRTYLDLNFSYRYKTKNGLRFTFTWAPVYTTYHVGHFDFLTNDFTAAVSTVTARRTLSAGFSHAIQNSLSFGGRVSSSTTVFLESLESFRMPSLVDWNPEAPVDSTARYDFYYSDLNASGSQFFSARTMSLGVSFSQFIGPREVLGLDYLYTRNRNKQEIGSDNAYNSHRVGISYQRGLGRGFAVNANYSFLYYSYTNPDSASNFTERRQNFTHLLSAGVTYSLTSSMSLYANFFYQMNHSNLPVGFVFSAADRAQNGLQSSTPGTPIGVQSTSLGTFSRAVLTTGISWSF